MFQLMIEVPTWAVLGVRLTLLVTAGLITYALAMRLARQVSYRPRLAVAPPLAAPRSAMPETHDPEVEQALLELVESPPSGSTTSVVRLTRADEDSAPLAAELPGPGPLIPALAAFPEAHEAFLVLTERLARAEAARQASCETPAQAWLRISAERERAASQLDTALKRLEQHHPDQMATRTARAPTRRAS